MRRRRFLGGVTGLAIWPGFPLTHRAHSAKWMASPPVLADRFLQACSKRSSAIEIGRAYLKELPSLPNAGQLVETLTCRLGASSSELKAMAPKDLRDRLRAQVSEDFSAGRTVRLRGWILGDAEVQLCALAALRSDQKNANQAE